MGASSSAKQTAIFGSRGTQWGIALDSNKGEIQIDLGLSLVEVNVLLNNYFQCIQLTNGWSKYNLN